MAVFRLIPQGSSTTAVSASVITAVALCLLGVLLLVAIVATPVAWRYALKDYQKSRIVTFLDPEQDARGAGYQQIQARISVGSGGPWGKGFLKGTQGQLRFLPVAWNDFVFSVFAEEQGLVGVLVALGLYLFVIVRALETGRLAKDRLGGYLVLGTLASFAFQVIYNVTMSAGLAPVSLSVPAGVASGPLAKACKAPATVSLINVGSPLGCTENHSRLQPPAPFSQIRRIG